VRWNQQKGYRVYSHTEQTFESFNQVKFSKWWSTSVAWLLEQLDYQLKVGRFESNRHNRRRKRQRKKYQQLVKIFGATTFSIMTFRIMTFSKMTFSMMTFSIMTCRIIDSIATLRISINRVYAECHYSDCHIFSLQCRVSFCWMLWRLNLCLHICITNCWLNAFGPLPHISWVNLITCDTSTI
jgi:hypothetical protein